MHNGCTKTPYNKYGEIGLHVQDIHIIKILNDSKAGTKAKAIYSRIYIKTYFTGANKVTNIAPLNNSSTTGAP